MLKTKILIVDDEALIAEYIQQTLKSLGFINTRLAFDKEEALTLIETFRPQLVLLDIRMEDELDGIQLAGIINQKYKIPFLFITAHNDKEIVEKALSTDPMGYITKPIKKMDVFAALNLAIKSIEAKAKRSLLFKDGYDTVKLPFDEILYAESSRNYVCIFTRQKKYLVRNSLEWFVEAVPGNEFLKVHRSFVVNTKKVTKRSSTAVFINEIEIPVSRRSQIHLD